MNVSYNLEENNSTFFQLNATDVDKNDILQYRISVFPSNGIVNQVANDGNISARIQFVEESILNSQRILLYTPNQYYNGIDMLIFRVTDGNGGESYGNVTFNISAVNQAPILDEQLTVDFRDPFNSIVNISFWDIDDTDLMFRMVTPPQRLLWSINGSSDTEIHLHFDHVGDNIISLQLIDDGLGGYQDLTADHQYITQFQYQLFDAWNASSALATATVNLQCDYKFNCRWKADGPPCCPCPPNAACSDFGLPVNKLGYYRMDDFSFLPCPVIDACPEGKIMKPCKKSLYHY